MHKFVSYNQEIIPFSKTRLSGVSSAALYGKGVFTTLIIHNGVPFLMDKHWLRLIDHASRVGIDIGKFSCEVAQESLRSLIAKNQAEWSRARLTFFDESESAIWNPARESRTSLLIQTADIREVPDHLNITVSSFSLNSKSPFTNLKSCNYLENVLALEEAKLGGFDEAIRMNEREEIVSACMANVFWLKNEKLFTPHLNTGCLAGTTRELVADIARNIGFDYIETCADLNEVLSADEVFLTSSGLSIASALRIDNVRYRGDRTETLKQKYNAFVTSQN